MTIEQKINREKTKQLFLKTAFFLFIVFAVCFLLKEAVFSLTENQKIAWYKNNAGLLENNSIFKNAIRSVGWAITKLIIFIGSGAEKIFDIAFGFVDFTQSKTVSGFIDRFKPVLLSLMALSLLWLGIVLIVRPEKKPDFATNVVIFFFVVMCSGVIFSMLNSAVIEFKNGVLGSKTQAVYEVTDSNTLDLINADKKGKIQNLNYAKDRGKGYFGKVITGKNEKQKEISFDLIDFNETLNFKSSKYGYSAEFKELLSKKVLNINGKLYLQDINDGFGINSDDDNDIGNEFYYRYKFNFIVGWIQLASLILVYLAMAYKTIRIVFELIVARILAYLYSTEISGGEKIKKIGTFIRDCYILLCVDVICVKVYSLFTAYISGASGISTFPQALFSLFVAFAVIDGPNLVEKLLGMDAGLKSSTGRILALGAGIKAGTSGIFATPARAVRKVQGIRQGDVDRGGFIGGLKGYYHGRDHGRDLAGKDGLKGVFEERAKNMTEKENEKERSSSVDSQNFQTSSSQSFNKKKDKADVTKDMDKRAETRKDPSSGANAGNVDTDKSPGKDFSEKLKNQSGESSTRNKSVNRFNEAMKKDRHGKDFSGDTSYKSNKNFKNKGAGKGNKK